MTVCVRYIVERPVVPAWPPSPALHSARVQACAADTTAVAGNESAGKSFASTLWLVV